jgi:DNA-binding CsgD family transcriptional regulator
MSLELCYQHLLDLDPVRLAAYAERVLLASPVSGDAMHRAAAHGQLALARYYQADVPSAIHNAAAARALIDKLPDSQLMSDLDACCYLAWSEACLQSFRDALRHLDRALEVARSGGRSHAMAQIMALRSIVFRRLGDTAAAMRCADEACAAGEQAGSLRWRMTALATRCEVAVMCGSWELAAASGIEALELARDRVDRRISQHVPACLAVMRFVCGQRAGYEDAIVGAFGGAGLPDLECGLRSLIYETLTWMAAMCGEQGKAEHWARLAGKASAGLCLPYSEGFAHLAAAEAHMTIQPQVARAQAQRAMVNFRRVGAKYELGRSTYVAALAAHVLGRADEAMKLMSEANILISNCGGAQLHHDVSARLRLASARDDGQPDDSVELSARQSQIADLVAGGMTNRQIARSLDVSEKTVETHLARIFSKLGVTNRAMLASSATRRTIRSR